MATKAVRATRAGKATAPSEEKRLDAQANLLKLISDRSRLKILRSLRDDALYVGQICERTGMSPPAASHHLALLRVGRIIEFERDGKRVFYRLGARAKALIDMLEVIDDM